MLRRSQRDELSDFVIRNVKGLTDGELRGAGAFGVVRNVTVGATTCIAKRIHDILQDKRVPPDDRNGVLGMFRCECKMLSQLRHPNVVQFVGVHYGKKKEDISLIMEALHTDLRHFVSETDSASVALSLRLGILLDVSYGLLYLHTHQPTPIIHRDLNPGNILLTWDLRAKIADLGVSKYLDVSKSVEHTMAPGAWDYMPPEAMIEKPTYDTSLDVFSFGHVTLCLGNHRILSIVLQPVGPSPPSPIRTRKKYVDSLGPKHIVYSLAIDCLQENPKKRPATKDICSRLQKLCRAHPRRMGEVLKAVEAERIHLGSNEGSQHSAREEEEQGSLSHIESTDDAECSSDMLFPMADDTEDATEDATEEATLQQRVRELEAEKEELKCTADHERHTAQVYQEDFEIERRDRVKAHKEKEEYKFQLQKLKEKIAQIEADHHHKLAELHVINAARKPLQLQPKLRQVPPVESRGHRPPGIHDYARSNGDGGRIPPVNSSQKTHSSTPIYSEITETLAPANRRVHTAAANLTGPDFAPPIPPRNQLSAHTYREELSHQNVGPYQRTKHVYQEIPIPR